MTSHAVFFSPSSSSRWLACPGSAVLGALEEQRQQTLRTLASRAAPEDDNESAALGTAIHQFIEEYDDTLGMDGIAAQIERELGCDDYVARQAAWICGQYTEVLRLKKYKQVRQEQSVALIPGVLFGTPDLVYLDGTTLVVRDIKTGRLEVFNENNTQMMIYAASVLPDYPKAKMVRMQIDAVRFNPGDPFEMSRGDLEIWRDEVLFPAVVRGVDPQAPLVPGPQCQYCPAKVVCQAYQQDLAATVLMAETKAQTLDGEGLEKLLLRCKAAAAAENDIKPQLIRLVEEDGHVLQSFRLQPPRATTKWSQSPDVVIERLRELGVENPTVPITPAQAKKQVELPDDLVTTTVSTSPILVKK